MRTLQIILILLINFNLVCQEVGHQTKFEICEGMRKLSVKREGLHLEVLADKSIGSREKRIEVSKTLQVELINLFKKYLENECSNGRFELLQISKCYIRMEDLSSARKYLKQLDEIYSKDSEVSPYRKFYLDTYLKIESGELYYKDFRETGNVDCCQDYSSGSNDQNEALSEYVESLKFLSDKKEWKLLIEYLVTRPVCLNCEDELNEDIYSTINKYLALALTELYDPESLVKELESCSLKEMNWDEFKFYSPIFKRNTHFITLKNYKFSLDISGNIEFKNEDKAAIIDDLKLMQELKKIATASKSKKK